MKDSKSTLSDGSFNPSSERQKDVSRKIVDAVSERQKINQKIMSVELEINLLRTQKWNMQGTEYQKKMNELTSERNKLKSTPYIK
ncbi:hypothetical protein FH403_11810 [Salmonella enterica]|nr:hypothetical protein [Salmonella enterica]ECD9475723.1 hypothetical protein [Salmonella enterica subsp. houtenae]